MRILSLILAFAIAASTFGAGNPATAAPSDQHACCNSSEPINHDNEDQHKDCGSSCPMTCCRTVTAPADPVATPLDAAPLAVRITLPALLADDLREPQSIFHPPRARSFLT